MTKSKTVLQIQIRPSNKKIKFWILIKSIILRWISYHQITLSMLSCVRKNLSRHLFLKSKNLKRQTHGASRANRLIHQLLLIHQRIKAQRWCQIQKYRIQAWSPHKIKMNLNYLKFNQKVHIKPKPQSLGRLGQTRTRRELITIDMNSLKLMETLGSLKWTHWKKSLKWSKTQMVPCLLHLNMMVKLIIIKSIIDTIWRTRTFFTTLIKLEQKTSKWKIRYIRSSSSMTMC